MEPSPAIPLPNIPPPESVLNDLPCRTCGYNLRMLATSCVCPECATPVVKSLRSELLREADPNWLATMHIGCKLAYTGIWAAWISIIFFQIFRFKPINTFAMPAAAATIALGTWMLCAPDPSGIGEDRYGRLRIWTRGLGIVQFGALLILVLSRSAHLSYYFLLQGPEMLARAAWGATLLWYLDRLASRTWQSKMGTGYRMRAMLFLGISAISLAIWAGQYLSPGFKNPIQWGFGIFFPWINILVLYGAVGSFDKVLKAEVTARTGRTVWRTAGSFLYSAGQLFRSKNANNK